MTNVPVNTEPRPDDPCDDWSDHPLPKTRGAALRRYFTGRPSLALANLNYADVEIRVLSHYHITEGSKT